MCATYLRLLQLYLNSSHPYVLKFHGVYQIEAGRFSGDLSNPYFKKEQTLNL